MAENKEVVLMKGNEAIPRCYSLRMRRLFRLSYYSAE